MNYNEIADELCPGIFRKAHENTPLGLMRFRMDEKEKFEFIQKNLGNSKNIAEGLRRFRKSALVLSKQRPRMIEEHPQEWVAFFDGEVRAADKSFEKLMGKIDEQGIPRGEILVRFIDRSERIMIL